MTVRGPGLAVSAQVLATKGLILEREKPMRGSEGARAAKQEDWAARGLLTLNEAYAWKVAGEEKRASAAERSCAPLVDPMLVSPRFVLDPTLSAVSTPTSVLIL